MENSYGSSILENFACDKAKITIDSGNLYLDAAKIGSLECINEYGNATLLLPQSLDSYLFDVTAEYGNIGLPADAPKKVITDSDSDAKYYRTEGTGKGLIKVNTETGDINIRKR